MGGFGRTLTLVHRCGLSRGLVRALSGAPAGAGSLRGVIGSEMTAGRHPTPVCNMAGDRPVPAGGRWL